MNSGQWDDFADWLARSFFLLQAQRQLPAAAIRPRVTRWAGDSTARAHAATPQCRQTVPAFKSGAGVSATQLDQSELTRQALRAGVPKVIQGLLQARSGTLQEDRQAMVDQVRKKAGNWRGFKGAELLKRTRP